MDLTELRSLMMLDLKMTLDTEISTAEANRCIQRAVDDLSRHFPRERIYELTYKNAITDEQFTTPAAQSDTSIVSAISINGETDGATLSIANLFPDIPRPLKVTLTDANQSISRMTLIIKGTDADGVYREERFFRDAGKVQTGKVYFRSIIQVELNEIGGNGPGDTISVGYGETYGVWIQLVNPIKPESDSIYSAVSKGGTQYTRDTDFEMDYANGRVQLKSGTTMVDATTYYANYTKSVLGIDISAIIPQLVNIVGVVYPVGEIPQKSVAFSIWENMLTIGSQQPGESQKSLVDGRHIAIYYNARQEMPTEVSSGSYPEHLDQVVAMGAEGYALLIEAIQYELQAVTDLAEIRTTLGYLGIGTDSPTYLYKLADDALDKVTDYLETNGTTDNAKDRLAEITDMETYLRDLVIKLADGTGAIADGNAYLDSMSTTDLDAASVGAVAWLLEGELLINKLNDGGPTVPERFADYARAKIQIAQVRAQGSTGYFQEANIRLSMLRTYIEESTAWRQMGETFIAEAQSRIAMMDRVLAESEQYQRAVENDLILSDRFRAMATLRLAEFRDTLRNKAEYRTKMSSIPNVQPI